MFDIRRKEDIVNDINNLKEICDEWANYRNCLAACINKFNIKKIINCDCSLDERFKCKKCNGTGCIILLNDEGE